VRDSLGWCFVTTNCLTGLLADAFSGLESASSFALLVRSPLIILCQVSKLPSHIIKKKAEPSQLVLLYICILYCPRSGTGNIGIDPRPLGFWQWTNCSQHTESPSPWRSTCMWGYSLINVVFSLIRVSSLRSWCRMDSFVWFLGFFSLGSGSTLSLSWFIRLVALLFRHRALLTLD